MKPLIGIVSAVSISPQGWPFLRAYDANVKAIERVGGLPVLVPCTLETDALRDLYDRLDGVLLPGGGDVDPAVYDDTPRTEIKMVDTVRDHTEIKLSRWAVEDQRPVFGICRGHQVFNVALGGTLVQDIPTFLETDLTHDISDGMARNTILHTVDILEDSLLSKVMQGTHFEVNSLHHQSIDTLAPSLRVTAHAPDGIVEATELVESHPFALTVQWHPEDMVDDDAAMLGLFRSFVEAASVRTSAARHG